MVFDSGCISASFDRRSSSLRGAEGLVDHCAHQRRDQPGQHRQRRGDQQARQVQHHRGGQFRQRIGQAFHLQHAEHPDHRQQQDQPEHHPAGDALEVHG
jgi:hypothetical protein